MFKCLFAIGVLLLSGISAAGAETEDEAIWRELRAGDHVVLIRHTATEAGIGDPPGFVHGDCSTQRNLSQQGRDDARRIGEAFRHRAIPIADVLSSRWCRCIDTAMLAFGKATPAAMLDSMFNDREKPAKEKIQEVFAAVNRRPDYGNLIMVTHNRNIQALAGVSPAPGEVVVVTPEGTDSFRLIGRLTVLGN